MKEWKKKVFIVWFAETIAVVGFNFTIPFLPYYIQKLGINNFKDISLWAGLLGTAPSISLIIASPFWGMIADRIGRKFMLIRAIFLGSVILFFMGMVKNVHQLFFLRLVQGLFTGTVTSAMALIASITPKEDSGFGFGLIHTSIFIGVFIGPILGGISIEKIGYRNSFCISVLFLLKRNLKETGKKREKVLRLLEVKYYRLFLSFF